MPLVRSMDIPAAGRVQAFPWSGGPWSDVWEGGIHASVRGDWLELLDRPASQRLMEKNIKGYVDRLKDAWKGEKVKKGRRTSIQPLL